MEQAWTGADCPKLQPFCKERDATTGRLAEGGADGAIRPLLIPAPVLADIQEAPTKALNNSLATRVTWKVKDMNVCNAIKEWNALIADVIVVSAIVLYHSKI